MKTIEAFLSNSILHSKAGPTVQCKVFSTIVSPIYIACKREQKKRGTKGGENYLLSAGFLFPAFRGPIVYPLVSVIFRHFKIRMDFYHFKLLHPKTKINSLS